MMSGMMIGIPIVVYKKRVENYDEPPFSKLKHELITFLKQY
jgi:hypothetical protein